MLLQRCYGSWVRFTILSLSVLADDFSTCLEEGGGDEFYQCFMPRAGSGDGEIGSPLAVLTSENPTTL